VDGRGQGPGHRSAARQGPRPRSQRCSSRSGTLKTGDVVLAGSTYGRVRAMIDEDGKAIKSAGPSIPVEIQGPDRSAAGLGDEFMVMSDERRARRDRHLPCRQVPQHQAGEGPGQRICRNMFTDLSAGEVQTLRIIIKADVPRLAGGTGSVAAQSWRPRKSRWQMVYAGVGGISESDINLAIASKGHRDRLQTCAPMPVARKLAESNGIQLHYYSIIYDAVDDIKVAMVRHAGGPNGAKRSSARPEIRTVFVGVQDRYGRGLYGHLRLGKPQCAFSRLPARKTW